MFVVNTEIEVNFLLQATTVPTVYTDFDIKVNRPDGSSDYYESAISESLFIAPTATTLGAIAYRFTPNIEGVWTITLTKGISGSYNISYEYPLRISTPDVHVHQQVDLG